MINVLTYFLAAAFLFYGINCMVNPAMKIEFQRYGIPQFRILTGLLQLFGALGLLIGIFYSTVGILAALGLALLMLAGFITRLKIRDGFLQTAPSFVFMLISSLLLYLKLQV